MVNDFKKPPPPQIFYMSLWNEAELTTIATAFPGVADWMERFRILGGIPRHVLEVTDHIPKALLEAALFVVGHFVPKDYICKNKASP